MTETQMNLTWFGTAGDETGFKIERDTEGDDCPTFTLIDTVATDVASYLDEPITASTGYHYRVRAYKTGTYPWNSGYSNEVPVVSLPQPADGLIATAVNSRMINLVWQDHSSDEEGFEIEVQIWNGQFALIDTVTAGVTTYTDHIGIDGETLYTYRVRPFRGEDKGLYSNEAVETSPAYEIGDGTCLP